MLERVEVVFDESAGYGLNQALSDFWNAWQALSIHPSGTTERSMVAATSEGLADAIRQKYGELEQIREDIDTAVESGIATINRLTAQIADLNQKIARTEIGGTNANDYRDRRDLVLKQLAEMIDIQSFEDADGQVVVSVARRTTRGKRQHQAASNADECRRPNGGSMAGHQREFGDHHRWDHRREDRRVAPDARYENCRLSSPIGCAGERPVRGATRSDAPEKMDSAPRRGFEARGVVVRLRL